MLGLFGRHLRCNDLADKGHALATYVGWDEKTVVLERNTNYRVPILRDEKASFLLADLRNARFYPCLLYTSPSPRDLGSNRG